MNVAIFRNGIDISNHVISYNRESKICTGIGTLEMEVDYSYAATIIPWDYIDIYEEGRHVAKYYVSLISEGQPGATITVTCQDNSKRLADYFITESTTVEYRSNAKKWITKFLNDAGVDWKFNSTGHGGILSNNTTLGMMSAYEQVMTLLQISGWYITFDEGGKAQIGKLIVSPPVYDSSYPGIVTNSIVTIDDSTITNISVNRNDKMYRNRVVVWGASDSDNEGWVYADITILNPWDYDENDRRTLVLANSNIPNGNEAAELADRALLEFNKLSVEKVLTVAGVVDAKVGDLVLLKSNLFTGYCLVTSYGVSMSKAGLVTNLVLDERCPRLFAYYHKKVGPVLPSGIVGSGYPVYVSTFGDGVWMKIGSGWYDYSYGLDELDITDLHVNNGILVNVTAAGDSYCSIEADGYWDRIDLNTLPVTISGVTSTFSGLMARACIIDRNSNDLRVVVDSRSGINYGDFLTETDPLSPLNPLLYSGYLIAPDTMRSWVVDANAYNRSVSNSYPVNLSGSYDIFSYDIANDGISDYISSMIIVSGYIDSKDNTPYGFFTGNRGVIPEDMPSYMAYSGSPYPIYQEPVYAERGENYDSYGPVALYDGLTSYCDLASVALAAFAERNWNASSPPHWEYLLYLWSLAYDGDGDLIQSSALATSVDYPELVVDNIVLIKRYNDYTFDYYNCNIGQVADPTPDTGVITRNRVDFLGEVPTVTVEEVATGLVNASGTEDSNGFPRGSLFRYVIVGDIYYYVKIVRSGMVDDYSFDVMLYWVDLVTGDTGNKTIVQKIGDTIDHDAVGDYDEFQNLQVCILQDGNNNVRITCIYFNEIVTVHQGGVFPTPPFYYKTSYYDAINRVTYDLDLDSVNDDKVMDWHSSTVPSLTLYKTGNFNPSYQYIEYTLAGGGISKTVVDTFSTFTVTDGSLTGSLSGYSTVYNVRGNIGFAIAKKLDGSFSYVDTTTGEPTVAIDPPTVLFQIIEDGLPILYTAEVTLVTFLGATDSINSETFWRAVLDVSGTTYKCIVTLSPGGSVTRIQYSNYWHDYASAQNDVFNNFLVYSDHFGKRGYRYTEPVGISYAYPMYTILKRDGENFFLIHTNTNRERIEISDCSPIVVMDRRVSSTTIITTNVGGSGLLWTHPGISGYNIGDNEDPISIFNTGLLTDDFRYANFSRVYGEGMASEILLVYSGGVATMDTYSLDSVNGLYTTVSGVPTRIETSNYQLPEQYLFLSVSGDGMSFFQRDPEASGVWVDYSSGYPQSRTTSIRLDDSL